MLEKPESVEEVMSGLNNYITRINVFPKGARLYRELYHFVLLAMDFLQDRTSSGWIRKVTKGKFDGIYNLEFVRGIFFNEMSLEWPEPAGDRSMQGISILERKMYHRQPVHAERYEYRRYRKRCKILSKVELDQWTDIGIDDYSIQ